MGVSRFLLKPSLKTADIVRQRLLKVYTVAAAVGICHSKSYTLKSEIYRNGKSALDGMTAHYCAQGGRGEDITRAVICHRQSVVEIGEIAVGSAVVGVCG